MNDKTEVIWSPNQDDIFITWGSDISVYKVKPHEDGQVQSGLKLNNDCTAVLLYKNNDLKYLKCVAWNPDRNEELLFACALASGQIVLSNLGTPPAIKDENIEFNLNSKHPRQCSSLKWSPLESNLLTGGFERTKADHSIYVFDIKGSKTSVQQPIYEKGKAEAVNSIAWLHHQERSIIAGMNHKNLKLFDMRDNANSSTVTLCKAVYDVTPDPKNFYRLASYFENQVYLWDLRYFEKPLSILNDHKHVLKLYWCPTRDSLLASLLKDSCSIKLYDIRLNSNSDEVEPSVIERYIRPCNETISSFSWHSFSCSKMLICTSTGSLVDYIVPERLSISWQSSPSLIWSEGKNYYKPPIPDPEITDISDLIKERSSVCYKLKAESRDLLFDLASEGCLKNLWQWMVTSKKLNTAPVVECSPITPDRHGIRSRNRFQVLPSANNLSFCGVRSILYGSNLDHRPPSLARMSNEVLVSWTGMVGSRSIKRYESEDRDKVLKLCGWETSRSEIDVSEMLENLKLDKTSDYCRLAALSVFSLKLENAIKYLEEGSMFDRSLTTIAMAVSGFSSESSILWRETCIKLMDQLSEPYLRVIFAFLTQEEPYDGVLSEDGISFQDKIAFCVTFLSDTNVVKQIEKLYTQMKDKGDLEGLLLTGLTMNGLDLLQQYIDIYGDVQIPSLLVVSGLADDPIAKNDERVKTWIESYRQLLDSWELWYERSIFDIQLHKFDPSSLPPAQVFASCNFCSKSISPFVTPNTKNNKSLHVPRMTGSSANKPKITSCQSCKKPLPRCSLCLKYMGTEAATHPPGVVIGHKGEAPKSKLSPLSYWFTWCQSCRHGGHADHMTMWFQDHQVCPVTGCSCRCMSIDSIN